MMALAKLRHRIAHWFGWNTGTVETWWTKTEEKRLMVGFRCVGCGELRHIAPSVTKWPKEEESHEQR